VKRAERARVTRRATLDATAIGIAPGDAVRLADTAAPWRVTRAEVAGNGVMLELTPLGATSIVLPADPGRVLAAPDRRVAATMLVAAELPPLDDARADTMRIAVLANGDAPGWRAAALLTSGDGGASWEAAGTTAAPAVVGRLTRPAAAGSAWLVDRATVIEVELAHDDLTLSSVDDAALDRGTNMAVLGTEMVQFRDAAQVAPRRWRLSTLLRARRGSGGGAWPAGTAFALIEQGCVATIAVPRARAGETIRLLASGIGDATPVATAVTLDGTSIAPPAPVRLRAVRRGDGSGDVRWVRRSRLGWRWVDGMDAPLGEERELYAVTIGARQQASEMPWVTLPAGTLPGGAVAVAVRQQGTLAPSAAITGMMEGDGR
jgi:hypothetical protein